MKLTESQSVLGPLNTTLLVGDAAPPEYSHLTLAHAGILRPLGKILLLLLSITCSNKQRKENGMKNIRIANLVNSASDNMKRTRRLKKGREGKGIEVALSF